MFKKKELSAAQIDAVETKDFFDRIVPGMIRFYTDHYICGNFYKSCWAVTEYPPNTEETAILAHLADRNGVTLRIYNRLVTSMEQRKIVQQAMRKNHMMTTTNDVNETIKAQDNINDVVELLSELRRNKENLLHTAVFIELKATSEDKLKELQADIQMELTRSKISIDRLLLRQKEGFLSVLPTGNNMFGSQFERVLPASSVANLYPLNYSGKTDKNGFYLGRDKYGSNVLVDFDKRIKVIQNIDDGKKSITRNQYNAMGLLEKVTLSDGTLNGGKNITKYFYNNAGIQTKMYTGMSSESDTSYRRTTWSARGKKQIVWRCISRLEHGKKYCPDSPTIKEEQLHKAIIHAINNYYSCRNDIARILKVNIETVLECQGQEEIISIENRLKEIDQARNDLVNLIASGGCDEDKLDSEFSRLYQEECQLSERLEILKSQNKTSAETQAKLDKIMDMIEHEKFELETFDNVLIRKLIECIKVLNKAEILVIFKGGYEVKIDIE